MSGNNPLVSVCIVSYNHEKYIEYCINTILNQYYKNIEILVLDDGSSDKSVEKLNELKSTCPYPFEIIAQKNSGCIGGNFNKLINKAKGKYLVIMSADDGLFPDAISKKVDIMENDETVQYVINSQTQIIDENNNLMPPSLKHDLPLDSIENPTAQDTLDLEYNKIHSYFIQGGLYRKSILDAIGGFDEDMVADDIVLRTRLARYILEHPDLKFVTLHESACYYRRHTSNISLNMVRQIKSVALYMNKYWGDIGFSEKFIGWINHHMTKTPKELYDLAFEIPEIKPYVDKKIKEIKSGQAKEYLKYLYYKNLTKITFGERNKKYKKEAKKLHNKVRMTRTILSLQNR